MTTRGEGTNAARAAWPPLPLAGWQETYRTLHLWTQVVGKVRMVRTPWLNHSWGATLYVSPRGLTTGIVPHGPGRAFQVDLDLLGHALTVTPSDGGARGFALEPMAVADFYRRLMDLLLEMGYPVEIVTVPNEMEEAVPFEADILHASYDPEAVARFCRVLISSHHVLLRFRSRFVGKATPVHFFWGAFDLAASRFSGRPAPPHPGGLPHFPDAIAREAYSHEVQSAGFWPGTPDGPVAEPAYYAYHYPAPEGYERAAVGPDAAFWSADLGEWVLPYEAVRTAADPEAALLEFLETTYAATAELAGWDREALERPEGRPEDSRG
jgi:hypothetical protein